MITLLLIAELFVLFFLSKRLIQHLYTLLFLVSHSRSFTVSIITLLLFPGTVIHELSHLFTAEILGVRTGKLILAPEAIRGSEIQAGSVAIAKTGPFRRVVIGLAPLLVGLGVITALSYWLTFPNLSSYILILISYLLFAISNSLFPSSLDMQGTPATIITVLLLFAAAYTAGIRLSLSGQSLQLVTTVLSSLVQSLGLVLAVNIGVLLIAQILLVLIGNIIKSKI